MKEENIDTFLNCTFSKIGINCANLGSRYLREIIKYVYINKVLDIKYKDLCYILSKKLNVNTKKIESNIYTLISTININIAKKNFQSIFNIEFDYFYISPKKLIILILNIMENKK